MSALAAMNGAVFDVPEGRAQQLEDALAHAVEGGRNDWLRRTGLFVPQEVLTRLPADHLACLSPSDMSSAP